MFPFSFNSLYKVRSLFDSNSAAINEKLSRVDCTLNDLLNEDEIVHELRMKNGKLISFLNIERVKQLIDYMTVMPMEDDQLKGHRYPFYACELLCSDENKINELFVMTREKLEEKAKMASKSICISKTEFTIEKTISITQEAIEQETTITMVDNDTEGKIETNDAANPNPNVHTETKAIIEECNVIQLAINEIVNNETLSNRYELLDQLLKFIDNDNELNHVLVGYFSKLFLHLFSKYPIKILNYLYIEQPSYFQKILCHSHYKSISDIISKIFLSEHLNQNIIPAEFPSSNHSNINSYIAIRNSLIKPLFCQITLTNPNFDMDNFINLCIDLMQCKDILLEFISNEAILTHMFTLLRTHLDAHTTDIVKHNYSLLIFFIVQLLKNIQSNNISLPSLYEDANQDTMIIKPSSAFTINPDDINYTPLSRFLLNNLRGVLVNFNDSTYVKELPSPLGYEGKQYKTLGLLCLRIIELVKHLFSYFKEIPSCLDEILIKEHFFTRAIDYFFKYEWNNIYQQNFINIFKLYINEERKHQSITRHLFTEGNFANVLMEKFLKDKAIFAHSSTVINPGYFSHIIYLCYKIYVFAGGNDMSNRSRLGSFNFVAISARPFDLQITSFHDGNTNIINDPHPNSQQQSPMKINVETCAEIKNSLTGDWFERFDAHVKPMAKRYEMKLCETQALTQDNEQQGHEKDSDLMGMEQQQMYTIGNSTGSGEGNGNEFNPYVSIENNDDGRLMEINDLFDEEVEQSFDPKPVDSNEMDELSNVIVDELDSKNYTEVFYWKNGSYDEKAMNDALNDLNLNQ